MSPRQMLPVCVQRCFLVFRDLIFIARKENRDANKGSVLEQLLSFIRHNSASNKVPSRNIYDEFFEVPHECHPNQASELIFPWVPSMKEFLDAVNQKSSDKPWLSGVMGHTTAATQEKEGWMYKILTQDCFNGPLVGSQVPCFTHLSFPLHKLWGGWYE